MKTRFICEENTSPKSQMPSNVSICPIKSVTMTNCSQDRDPDEDDEHADELPWDGFWQFGQKFFCYANWFLQQLSRVAGLRRSWRWRCWIWRSWAGVVTRGLRLWGRLDVLPNSLKRLRRQLIVEIWTFNSQDIPAVSMPFACSLKILWHCAVIKLHILEWSFIVASLHTCAINMPSNQHLDMPHLWGGWLSRQMRSRVTLSDKHH